MLNKCKLRVKYSNDALFTKAGEFLSHFRHMFVMRYKKRGSSSRDFSHTFFFFFSPVVPSRSVTTLTLLLSNRISKRFGGEIRLHL